MPLSLSEALAELPEVLAVVKAVEDAIASAPKEGAKPSDFIHVAVSILQAAAPLADKVQADIKS